MSRQIFLHEIIDIVGQNAWAYMEHAVACSGEAANGLELLGTWYTVGMTGRWTQVVNIWELPGGWRGWHDTLDRLGQKRRSNRELEAWWEAAFKLRSGGTDRQLGGVPGCPDRASLAADGVRGSLFTHELSQVRPGAGPEYLQAVQEEWVPLAREYGLEPVGLYEVLMHDTEVCTVFAGDVDAIVKIGRAYDACRGFDAEAEPDARIADWRRRAREYCTTWREELMVPLPGTLCTPHPPQ